MSLYGAIDKSNCGKHVVTAAEVTATVTSIDTGVTDPLFIDVTIQRGVAVDNVLTVDAVIEFSTAGFITVEDGAATYALTAGDIIRWIAVSESK